MKVKLKTLLDNIKKGEAVTSIEELEDLLYESGCVTQFYKKHPRKIKSYLIHLGHLQTPELFKTVYNSLTGKIEEVREITVEKNKNLFTIKVYIKDSEMFPYEILDNPDTSMNQSYIKLLKNVEV